MTTDIPPHRLLFTKEQIEATLADVCQTIYRDAIRADGSRDVVVVTIMSGAHRTAQKMIDIIGKLDETVKLRLTERPLYISRTAGSTLRTPLVQRFDCDSADIAGKTVLIVDDMMDEGETLALAKKTVEELSPHDVITFVLVNKGKSDVQRVRPDHSCFELGYTGEKLRNKWLFGYGIDLDEKYRDCDYIAEFDCP